MCLVSESFGCLQVWAVYFRYCDSIKSCGGGVPTIPSQSEREYLNVKFSWFWVFLLNPPRIILHRKSFQLDSSLAISGDLVGAVVWYFVLKTHCQIRSETQPALICTAATFWHQTKQQHDSTSPCPVASSLSLEGRLETLDWCCFSGVERLQQIDKLLRFRSSAERGDDQQVARHMDLRSSGI